MKENNIYSKKDISLLPIGFQFFHVIDEKKEKRRFKPKFFYVKKYQTTKHQTTRYYKQISKIIKNE